MASSSPTMAAHSQVLGRPTFRDSAMHAVAIVPLSVNNSGAAVGSNNASLLSTSTHSERSFHLLLSSLREFANHGHAMHQRNFLSSADDDDFGSGNPVTLILPHSQLTPPGDWKYNATPLRGHDWQSGCQRIRIFDGRANNCRMATDRVGIKVSEKNGVKKSTTLDPWGDLEPHRQTSAVIGVFNLRDCHDRKDLKRAEENLLEWTRVYAGERERENVYLGVGDDLFVNAPVMRLFIFDSFDESVQQKVDLRKTRFTSNQLVAFPPLNMNVSEVGNSTNSQMMALHWNVVVNDLAVALFRNVERRIQVNDALSKMLSKGISIKSNASITPSSISGASDSFVDDASLHSTMTTMTTTSTTSTSNATSTATTTNPGLGLGLLANAKKTFDAIDNRRRGVGTAAAVADHRRAQSSSSSSSSSGPDINVEQDGITKLVTPLDLDADADDVLASVTPRDIEALRRRDAGRREKRSADLSLLAGSPIDAYERYTRAAELTRHSHDPLWYASALEGCACAFVAMADCGGHGVDEYLENNFQLPDVVMALAIAQGVASGADLENVKGKTMTVDRTKTTLPQAVTALVEEALSVLCRHATLAPLHAGLLMKLAEYVMDDEEGHLRCRWGEGEYCYGGDANSGKPPRRKRTSVSKLELRGPEVREILAQDSIERGRKFTELLHRAVSVGGLDDRSRSDVAAACARACLIGTKETRWGDSASCAAPSRLRFPRKAAFFTLVAAEALTLCQGNAEAESAASLYLAASHLYSLRGNMCENGEDCITRYGWASLRISVLQGLSSQLVEKETAETATELLMALFSEISANQTPRIHISDGAPLLNDDQDTFDRAEFERQQQSFGNDSLHGSQHGTRIQSDGKVKQVSKPLASMAKIPKFGQSPPSALSLSQSKWLEDDPVSPIELPFMNTVGSSTNYMTERASALSSTVVSMSCVTARIDFEKCAKVQQICQANLKDLRHRMGASSAKGVGFVIVNDWCSADDTTLPSPLVVTSAKIVKEGSHLILERTKALGYSAKFATHSMSTFFNPYAKKKQAEKDKTKIMTYLIAEGEERNIMVEFYNRLAVPLEVPSCQLEFEGKGTDRIEAPPLSFTVPAKTSSFAVHFPFIVAVSKDERGNPKEAKQSEVETNEADVIPEPDFFDVVGLHFTCLNRTFSIHLCKTEEQDVQNNETCNISQIPPPASVYQLSKHTQPKKDTQQLVVRLESVPAQPNLLVSFAASQSPMEEDVSVPVHLSDGEIFTIPPFRLENDFGRSGMGEIERIQILAVGLPGIPDETLFDTDALAAKLEEEEDVLTESDSEIEDEDFDEMMECDGLPPLKMKVIAEGLNLKSINDKSKNKGEGSIVKFQMAATHDMGDQLSNGGNVRIRFRYRGPSPNPATEIWRKREVTLRIIRVKGPRISSLTFRSDLIWGSAYTELCQSLAKQRRLIDTNATKWDSSSNKSHLSPLSDMEVEEISLNSVNDDVEQSIVNRVGMDQGIHVSSDEVVFLLAVANESSSTIILSNRKGLVGGFEGSPMSTVRVLSGVSVKIPVVIPRIDRMDENGNVTDLAAELVALTALQWESEAVEGADSTEKIKRHGRVRIPSRCLREIIDEHKSFAVRICKAPVLLKVSLGGDPKLSEITLPVGSAVQVDAGVAMQNWVPADIVAKCKLTLEFCCAEKQLDNSSSVLDDGAPPYIWCGQLRRSVDLFNDEDDKTHLARIVFFQCGVFVVSVCAKISSQDGIEESWWSPQAKIVRIKDLEDQ